MTNQEVREACAKVAETRHEHWRMPNPGDAAPGEVCDDISACRDIAAAIRALPLAPTEAGIGAGEGEIGPDPRYDEDDLTELDVFLSGYCGEPDGGLVNRREDDDLLTWGVLRRIRSALVQMRDEAPKPPLDEQRAREVLAKLKPGYPDYIDDPDGLDRLRVQVRRYSGHDMAICNNNSLGRLIDTIERLRRERDDALATSPLAAGDRLREAGIAFALADAHKMLALTESCLECNADDERRWSETIAWLEGLA